jgi:hypothetical protein
MHAGDLLRQAIALEPDYAAAHAWYAFWHVFLVGQAWTDNPAAAMAEAGRLANRAITLDPQDARGLTIAGHVRAFLHRRLREAVSLHERALTVNPNLVMAWALSAAAFAYLGEFEEADKRMRRYKKLSPLDPHAFFYDCVFILVALLRHDHEEAARIGRAVSEMNPAFSTACKPYLAALGHLGWTEETAQVRQRLLSIEPDFSIARFLEASPCERPEDRLHYAAGLRLAGVPEGLEPLELRGVVHAERIARVIGHVLVPNPVPEAAIAHHLSLPSRAGSPQSISVGGRPLVVGRLQSCDLQLTGKEVSRRHCRFELVQESVVLTDLGSMNGTFLDNVRIQEPVALHDDAEIQVGSHLLRYTRLSRLDEEPTYAGGLADWLAGPSKDKAETAISTDTESRTAAP